MTVMKDPSTHATFARMLLIPFDSRTLVTSLSKKEILLRLTRSVGKPYNWWFDAKPARPLAGEVHGDGFEVHRNITYRNSFLPIIFGKITEDGAVTEVRIRMRMHAFVIVFMAFWMGAVCLGSLVSLVILTKGWNPFGHVVFIPFAMAVFGYLLMMGGFLFEHRRSMDLLKKLLDATEV